MAQAKSPGCDLQSARDLERLSVSQIREDVIQEWASAIPPQMFSAIGRELRTLVPSWMKRRQITLSLSTGRFSIMPV
jgi:hypothetical protein